ncbi:lipocalin family protein [Chitinimonas sp.]|uniref:lipocalin family protein n=1 Tax=Chitinimonas sp. TaxID=1934313 RepID=UPI0035ADEE7C
MALSTYAALLFLVHAPAQAEAPVASVAQLDLNRYMGQWYEIASFPMFFQRQCIADTTANYAIRPDGAVSVLNRCRTKDGFDSAEGKATVVEGGNNAKLKVSFFWPFKADYWVIGLDPDYRWAVVGNPNRKYLWLLSRTPNLPKPLLDEALAAASAQGFDLAQLRYTPQTASP